MHSDKPSLSPQHRPGAWQMISNCGGVQEQKQAWGWGPPSVLLVPLSKDMRSREAAQKKMGVLAAASGLRLQGGQASEAQRCMFSTAQTPELLEQVVQWSQGSSMPGAAPQMPAYTEESEDCSALSSTREELQPLAVSADWALR